MRSELKLRPQLRDATPPATRETTTVGHDDWGWVVSIGNTGIPGEGNVGRCAAKLTISLLLLTTTVRTQNGEGSTPPHFFWMLFDANGEGLTPPRSYTFYFRRDAQTGGRNPLPFVFLSFSTRREGIPPPVCVSFIFDATGGAFPPPVCHSLSSTQRGGGNLLAVLKVFFQRNEEGPRCLILAILSAFDAARRGPPPRPRLIV